MANTLLLKRSSVVNKVPLATDLTAGELAVNLADKRLYSKDGSGDVIQVGGDPTAFKQAVRCATTANITLSGTQTIDGVSVVANDRVLVKNQSSTGNNGIYIASASTWTRAADMDTAAEAGAAVVAVQSGTTNGGSVWFTSFKSTDTLGTTAMTWFDVNDLGSVSGTLAAANGGTGLTSYAVGDIIYASGATTLAKLADVATGNALISGGVTTAPAWGKIGLTTHVSGTLPIANGGTNATTALDARISLLPSYTGNAGKVLAVNAGATDVQWISASGTGTVTSVDVSGGTTGLTTSGGPITSAGTITLAGTLAAANGGTGQTTYAVGDILYASTTTALSKLADVATGNALISGGVGTAPSWGKIGLTTHVSGTLPTANGGTNLASFTANGAVYATSTSALTTGTLPVASGGTGATTLTGLVLGNGTSAFTTVTAPSGTVVGTTDTQTLTNKRVNPRVSSTTSITSPLAWNSDNFDQYAATAQSAAFTISADAGTPVDGQKATFRFKDNGTTRTITFTGGVSKGFRPVGVTLTTSGSNFTYATTASKTVYLGCVYNAADSRWDVVALSQEA